MARIKYYNTTNNAWEYADATGISQSTADRRYVKRTGDTISGNITINNSNPNLGLQDSSGALAYFQTYNDGSGLKAGFGYGWANSLKIDASGNMTVPGTITGNLSGTATNATNIYSSASTTKAYVLGTTTASSANHATVYNASVYTSGSVLYGAAWNDYAEYRETTEIIEPGRVVCENNDDTLSLSQERLQSGAEIVSDTFGFAIGETEQCKTPIAAAGRVLAYPYEDRNTYNAGDPVCAGPNGTVSKMTREEVREYPDRMIGTVSAVPTYETWGENNVPVNGRIWIRIK